VIYFIRNERSGAIKIGYSQDPRKRLSQLKVSSPDPLVLLGTIHGGIQQERKLHAYFREYRLRGEWYQDDPYVLNAVLGMINQYQNVMKACEARGCRYGLAGVRMLHLPSAHEFYCTGSEWGPDEILLVFADEERWMSWEDPVPDYLGLVRLSDVCPDRNRPRMKLPATECVLLSPWPVVCCEPC
jgi:hypothetical protein